MINESIIGQLGLLERSFCRQLLWVRYEYVLWFFKGTFQHPHFKINSSQVNMRITPE